MNVRDRLILSFQNIAISENMEILGIHQIVGNRNAESEIPILKIQRYYELYYARQSEQFRQKYARMIDLFVSYGTVTVRILTMWHTLCF